MKTYLQSLFNTSKIQMGLFIFLIAISATLHYQSLESVFTIFLSLIATLSADIIFVKLRKIRPFFPSAAIVTGLIIGLLTYFQLPWYEIVTTGIVAMIAKNLLRIHNRHIFNPAAFGLFTTSLLFSQSVSWWGVSFQNLSSNIVSILLFIVVICPGFVSMFRLRRYFISISFMTTYILFNSIIRIIQHSFNPITTLQVTLFSSTILFFSVVMLPEPMTSPNKHKRQIIYGSFIGIVSVILSMAFPKYLPDPIIAALLVGNAVFFKNR